MRDVLTEEECLQMAAQCWCDVETSKMNIDLHLAKAFAKRLQSAARLGAERERATMDAALDLLETMYRLWENGIDCYLDPEDQTGYLGKAVDLDDLTERKIADLLNEHRPANPTLDDAVAIRRGEDG